MFAMSATTTVSWQCPAPRCAVPCCTTLLTPTPAAFQSVLSNCSATSNVACGCKPGHFRSCLNEHCNEFSCSKCQLCPGRLVQRPCESCHPVLGVPPPGPTAVLTCALSPGSDTQDTLCGSCKPNFYAKGSECRPCHM